MTAFPAPDLTNGSTEPHTDVRKAAPGWLAVTGVLIVLGVVGGADYVTGHELLLSTFYLIPVAMAAWMVGRNFALMVSVLSVGVWLVGDLASGAVFARPFVATWNSAIILAFYVIVALLIDRLRTMQRNLEVRVRDRTLALTEEMAERERLEREILDAGERERRRIGRDLHDSLGQLLTGTALAGQAVHQRLADGGSAEASGVARVVSLVEEAIEMTRGLARGLDPLEMEGGGLAQGLRQLAATTSALTSTRCTYLGAESIAIEDSVVATHLYRIAQEAITNAIKHGRAANISVDLVRHDNGLRLTVRDDGLGIPESSGRSVGMGLRVMAHRAAVMGGSFEVRREGPRGTRVTCDMPSI